MNADKEVQRSIGMPLIDILYEFVEVESAEEAAKRLEREKQNLQSLLDEALKAQGEPKAHKRTREEAGDPSVLEAKKVAEQGKLAKAEADKFVDEANKQVIYEQICLTEYDTPVRGFASTMAWFKSGRKAVREMVADQAKEDAQGKAAKIAKKKADL